MPRKRLTWQIALPYVLTIGGVLGLIASFALTYDKIHILQDPSYEPGCSLNPVLSCGSVMSSEQASILGVPNTIFGLIAFAMLLMVGLMLLAGAQFKRWLWIGLQLGATVGFVFMHYLLFEAVFRIHAICPWCFLVWLILPPIFLATTIYNIRQGNLGLQRNRLAAAIGQWVERHGLDLLVLWYVALVATLLIKFWYYWSTLL